MNNAEILKRLKAQVAVETMVGGKDNHQFIRAKVISIDDKKILAIADHEDEKTAIDAAVDDARKKAGLPDREPSKDEMLEKRIAALESAVAELKNASQKPPVKEPPVAQKPVTAPVNKN